MRDLANWGGGEKREVKEIERSTRAELSDRNFVSKTTLSQIPLSSPYSNIFSMNPKYFYPQNPTLSPLLLSLVLLAFIKSNFPQLSSCFFSPVPSSTTKYLSGTERNWLFQPVFSSKAEAFIPSVLRWNYGKTVTMYDCLRVNLQDILQSNPLA